MRIVEGGTRNMRESTYGHLFTPSERMLLKRMQLRREVYIANPDRVRVVLVLERLGYCTLREGGNGRWLVASATPLGLTAKAGP